MAEPSKQMEMEMGKILYCGNGNWSGNGKGNISTYLCIPWPRQTDANTYHVKHWNVASSNGTKMPNTDVEYTLYINNTGYTG